MRKDHGVSQRGVHKLNAVFSEAMDLAVKEHLVKHGPCRDVDVLRPRSAERMPLTFDETPAAPKAAGVEFLVLQRGLGAPVLLEGGRLTVMAEGA